MVSRSVHRNLAAQDWFTGTMAVTNSFIHEIDVSRWLAAMIGYSTFL